jgi:hypothetical protein
MTERRAGFTQILLTYTLSVITALLGLSTLWLACGTLARDIEECQMQVVATKPIARWQIWLGKWAGHRVAQCSLAGDFRRGVFMRCFSIAQRSCRRTSRRCLRNEVLVARSVRSGSLTR